MWEDGYATSRPIKIDINSAGDLVYLFDEIIYSKGAAVIRMLESIVTPDEFQKNLIVKLNFLLG